MGCVVGRRLVEGRVFLWFFMHVRVISYCFYSVFSVSRCANSPFFTHFLLFCTSCRSCALIYVEFMQRSWWGWGGFSGRNNVLSLVSWFRHSWSYVPPFFPCNFHHVFNAIYARTFLCKFQYAFHAMLWTFVAMWMPPICSASTFQRKMLRPTDFVQVFFRAVERSSNGIVPISEPTITPKGQVLDIK